MANRALPLVAIGLLAGCTPGLGGVVGLTRGADGGIVAVVVICRGYIDGFSLQQPGEAELGRWRRKTAIHDEASLPLQSPGPEWTIDKPLAGLPGGAELELHGFSEDQRWTTYGPSFAAGDLSRLRSGEVWLGRSNGGSGATSVSSESFRDQACKDGRPQSIEAFAARG